MHASSALGGVVGGGGCMRESVSTYVLHDVECWQLFASDGNQAEASPGRLRRTLVVFFKTTGRVLNDLTQAATGRFLCCTNPRLQRSLPSLCRVPCSSRKRYLAAFRHNHKPRLSSDAAFTIHSSTSSPLPQEHNAVQTTPALFNAPRHTAVLHVAFHSHNWGRRKCNGKRRGTR